MGTGRLKKLLIVRYADAKGRDHEVVFANVPSEGFGMIGPLAQNSSDRGGYELVSKIMAARARSTPSEPEPASEPTESPFADPPLEEVQKSLNPFESDRGNDD